ncbi:MAG: tetratricopeptide repeat protein, partial [Spirochaetaceae bacterium]|nr:tetratricopeptide repeat protein [Spirochaetaceae bacterium]
AYDHLGRTDDARSCYKKALEQEPDYVKAALNLHDSYQEKQELNEALEEINKQITHHPRDPEIRVRMAETLMGLSRWEEAERSLDHVLERNPDHLEALRTKADLFLSTKRPEEAEKILKKLPHNPEVVRTLAKLNISSNRPETAERLLGELISVNAEDSESRRVLADLVAEKKPEEALRLREEAAEATPGNTGDMISLADLYSRTGKKDQALGKLEEAVNILGSRSEAEALDEMDAVLGLYEKAAAALENEKGDLFTERTAQLARKLQSAIGQPDKEFRSRGAFAIEEIPLDEEDALSLLDLNAMEPVIRINEEEETVYLEESTEDLEEAYTELYRPENMGNEPGFPASGSTPTAAPAQNQPV